MAAPHSRLYRLFAGDPWIVALGVTLLLYYVLTPGIFQGKASGDGYYGFMYLPGVLLHHSLDLHYTLTREVPPLGTDALGRMVNPCPIGPPLIWAPAYVLGLLLQKLHLVRTPSGQPFGQAQADFWFAGLGALFFGQMGIAAMFRFLRRNLDLAAARFGTITAVLATPLCFYLVTQPLYQHACAFAAVALFIDRWDAWRPQLSLRDPDQRGRRLRRWMLLGALAGMGMLMRVQEAIFLLLPGLDLLKQLGAAVTRRGRQAALPIAEPLQAGALVLGAAGLVFLPQALVWIHDFGSLRTPQPPGHMRWLEPALVEALFSMRAGLFPWVPALYLALPGLFLPPLRPKSLGIRLGLLFFVELWVNAAAWDYHGSWAFGPRRFTDATPIFAAGLGSLFLWLGRRRLRSRLLSLCAVLLIAYNVLLMELVRLRRVKSASSGAFPAAEWVRWAHGPKWLEQALLRFGYPFAQPAGWLYALAYQIPPSAFEGIVGNYFLERDWRVRTVFVGPTAAPLFEPSPYVFADPLADQNSSSSTRRLRVLIPLYTAEPLRLRLHVQATGRASATSSAGAASQPLALSWNGTPLPLSSGTPSGATTTYTAAVPEERVHSRARLNVVTIQAPQGLPLDRLELESYVPWWRRSRPR